MGLSLAIFFFLKVECPFKTFKMRVICRFGLALEKLGDFASARRSMEKALKHAPKDPSITRALVEVGFK